MLTPRNGPTRRTFIQSTAAGLAAASLARAASAQAQGQAQNADNAVTAAQQSGKRIGFAVMGLGQLGMGQILPAFQHAKVAKVTALVSGHPDKARAQAEKYGVDPKNIYNYDNFDKPGYDLSDYAAKWSNSFGPGELAAGGTQSFAGGAAIAPSSVLAGPCISALKPPKHWRRKALIVK